MLPVVVRGQEVTGLPPQQSWRVIIRRGCVAGVEVFKSSQDSARSKLRRLC